MKMSQNYKTIKRSAMVVTISVFFIALVVTAATTISNNIVTGGNLTVTGWASSTSSTSTNYLYVGADFDEGSLFNFAGGDLAVRNDVVIGGTASTTGDLYVSGGTFALTTSTATTTMGVFVQDNDTATSTLSVGGGNNMTKGCLEMVGNSGLYHYCIINEAGTGIQCAPGRCSD